MNVQGRGLAGLEYRTPYERSIPPPRCVSGGKVCTNVLMFACILAIYMFVLLLCLVVGVVGKHGFGYYSNSSNQILCDAWQ